MTVQAQPLISIRSNATVKDTARLMADCSIGAIGVLDGNHDFAGIVTERDLAWFVAQGRDASETVVAEITNDFPVVVVEPLDDVAALERMRSARRHLVVRDGTDFRIVSMRDYMSQATSPPTARDVMTAPAVACREDAFFEEVAEILAERDISGMPVVDQDNVVVGVVSERDLAYALGGPMVRLAVRRRNDHPLRGLCELPRGARRAREIMTTPALTVTPATSLDEIARVMHVHEINRLPVIDGATLVGVVTRGDVLGALAQLPHRPIDLTSAPIVVGSAGSRLAKAGSE
jgi:CBS domain-containing protein